MTSEPYVRTERIGMSINRVDICLSRSPERPVLISGLVLSSRHASACEVRAQLRALGVRPRPRVPRLRSPGGWDSLTGTERAVSLLVAGDWRTVRWQPVHLPAHREHPPAARVRGARRARPDRAGRRGISFDQVMSWPSAQQSACSRLRSPFPLRPARPRRPGGQAEPVTPSGPSAPIRRIWAVRFVMAC